VNRKFLEQLTHFIEQADSRVDQLQKAVDAAQSLCKHCSASTHDKLYAALSEATRTSAYLSELLDTYWSTHNNTTESGKT
jgi:ABC-type transporter Mla subunit MlaD